MLQPPTALPRAVQLQAPQPLLWEVVLQPPTAVPRGAAAAGTVDTAFIFVYMCVCVWALACVWACLQLQAC